MRERLASREKVEAPAVPSTRRRRAPGAPGWVSKRLPFWPLLDVQSEGYVFFVLLVFFSGGGGGQAGVRLTPVVL